MHGINNSTKTNVQRNKEIWTANTAQKVWNPKKKRKKGIAEIIRNGDIWGMNVWK